MRPALGYKWIKPVETWCDLPNGQMLFNFEQTLTSKRLGFCFGNHLLKIGSLASEINTSESLINHQVNISVQNSSDNIGVIGEIDDLPLLSQSIDAAVLNHVLEFSADPHQTLREVHRILIPNGNLVLTVFNPISLIFIAKIWPFKRKTRLWQCRLFTIARIKDWLHLLGFEVIDEQYGVYSTLLGQRNLDKKTDKDNRLIRWLCSVFPKFGSVCVITAKKREWPLTPIRPRVRIRTVFQPAVRTASMSKPEK